MTTKKTGPSALCELARLRLEEGKPQEAEAQLRQAVTLQPGHVTAVQELTALLADQGRLDEAHQLLDKALTNTPNDAAIHHNLGFVLAKQNQLAAAEHHFREALAHHPDNIDALRNLALCLSQQGRHRDVLPVCQRVVELRPNAALHWHELGRVRRRLKQYDEAVSAFRKAIELEADQVELHHDLGLALGDKGDDQAAEAAYRKSLELNPDFVEALNNLGVQLEGQGRLDEAVELLRRAVELKKAPDLWNNLGVALAARREFPEAIECYESALHFDENYAAALNNLGNAQRSLGQIEKAIVSLRSALRIRPDYAEAYNNLAIALVQSGRHREAMRFYNLALHFRPDYAEAHMNRSLDRLAMSDFAAGWIEYEWRWRGKQLRPRYADRPRWDGSSPAGKRIFIHFEQGLGDTFQFIRYAKLLKQHGATVLAEVQPPIVKLLQLCEDIDHVIQAETDPPDFDFHAPLISLPGLLGTELATIPADVPYLQADQALIEHWKKRLAPLSGFKIGIAWQGNPEYRGDRHRSIALRHFRQLAAVPGITLISLQKGHGTEQLEPLAGDLDVTVFDDLDAESGAFMDTAAIMKNLDLVVTSDTALPHLAGALGVPVWIALPIACDWRWMHGREDSPWYPTMRIFRQRQLDNWDKVFARITSALTQRLQEAQTVTLQQSPDARLAAESEWQDAVRLIQEHQLDEAERKLVEALQHDFQNAKIHHDLGVVRGRQKRPELAVASFRRSLELDPKNAGTWSNLGLAFLEQYKIDEAISHLQRALALGPNAPETFNNLGVAYMRNAQSEHAADNYQRALRLRPDYAEAHLNLARALLHQGDFEQGWLEYEWRWRCPGYQLPDDSSPRWGGEPLGDRTILLHGEQGLGDTLQFVRLASLVRQSGGQVLLACQSSLKSILARCPFVDEVVPHGHHAPTHDVHAPLMSLPSLLGLTLQNLPPVVPYLSADPELVSRWQDKLRRIPGFRIGISWQGNPHFDGDAHRSMQLKQLAPLASVADVRLINLQKGPGSDQLAELDEDFSVVDFGTGVDETAGGFMDTAAMMTHLELVITTDMAVAHLAGALGVPVWLLLSTSPDFRWMMDRADSPWYPSMTIFRQQSRGDWDQVIQRVVAALKARREPASRVR